MPSTRTWIIDEDSRKSAAKKSGFLGVENGFLASKSGFLGAVKWLFRNLFERGSVQIALNDLFVDIYKFSVNR